MTFAKLLLINALATFAAGVVLFVRPGLIASAVGIELPFEANFLAYLLGASELAFAALCCLGMTLTETRARRVVAFTCIVFHGASGAAGVLALMQGVSGVVWWNVGLRVLMVVLFGVYGFRVSPVQRSS